MSRRFEQIVRMTDAVNRSDIETVLDVMDPEAEVFTLRQTLKCAGPR